MGLDLRDLRGRSVKTLIEQGLGLAAKLTPWVLAPHSAEKANKVAA